MHRRFLFEIPEAASGGKADAGSGRSVCIGKLLTHQDSEEGCLSTTIASNEAKLLSGGDREGDVREELVSAKAFGEVCNSQDAHKS
jgi:hypothetical protein